MRIQDYRSSHLSSESWARNYDSELFSPGSFDSWMWTREQQLLNDIVQQRIGRKDDYLDFACGTGRVLSHLEGSFRSAVGVDISETMLATARERVQRATLLQGDLTRDSTILEGRQFDFITAFRFFLNAESTLRDEAMASLASKLKDKGSHLFFNIHGNRHSTRALLAAKAMITREHFASMSVRESMALAKRHGLEIVEWYGLGIYDKSLLNVMPLRLWNFAERITPRSKRLSVYLYFLCRLR